MFDLSLLPDGGLAWLDASGDQSDVVLSTRVRLARNVEGYAFTGRSREGERLRILAQVRDAVPAVPSLNGGVMVRVDELASDDRRLLHERHVISRELAGLEGASGARGGAAVYVGDGVGVMINEEDHLRPRLSGPASHSNRRWRRFHSWTMNSDDACRIRFTVNSDSSRRVPRIPAPACEHRY